MHRKYKCSWTTWSLYYTKINSKITRNTEILKLNKLKARKYCSHMLGSSYMPLVSGLILVSACWGCGSCCLNCHREWAWSVIFFSFWELNLTVYMDIPVRFSFCWMYVHKLLTCIWIFNIQFQQFSLFCKQMWLLLFSFPLNTSCEFFLTWFYLTFQWWVHLLLSLSGCHFNGLPRSWNHDRGIFSFCSTSFVLDVSICKQLNCFAITDICFAKLFIYIHLYAYFGNSFWLIDA